MKPFDKSKNKNVEWKIFHVNSLIPDNKIFQVSASQRVCVRTKIPSLGYADTVKVVLEGGPKPLRKFAGFAK